MIRVLSAAGLAVAVLSACSGDNTFEVRAENVSLKQAGRYLSGAFDESAAEIVAFDPGTRRIFVVNAQASSVDVIDAADIHNLRLQGRIDLAGGGLSRKLQADEIGAANSVAVHDGLIAIAVENANKQAPGFAVFYDARSLELLAEFRVGALPDMITFTPNGRQVLVANEGEPNDDYSIDPEGSVSVIDLSRGLGAAQVQELSFSVFNQGAPRHAELPAAVRIFGPGASVAQDLEPEYIAVAPDSRRAFVSLQENNAVAILRLQPEPVIESIVALGFKDHARAGQGLDASNRDGAINIRNWPVFGMYQPDSMAAFSIAGASYFATANEGDARDYDGFSEEARVKDLSLDPAAFPDAASLQQDENLGRLNITTTLGDTDGDGRYEALYSYGARSFSIRDAQGRLVYDSGDELERIIARELGMVGFNSNNDENDSVDARSDDKGPEPEAIAYGRAHGRDLLFVGAERVGGIFVYDVEDPAAPRFLQYLNNRDFAVADVQRIDAGDLGPEGFAFVAQADSPSGQPLLIVGSEVSGTTTVYEILPR